MFIIEIVKIVDERSYLFQNNTKNNDARVKKYKKPIKIIVLQQE